MAWPDLRRARGDERAAVAALHALAFNFDPSRRGEYTPENGWHVDRYCRALPPETPGPPEPGGPWEIARRLMRHYEFANPRQVSAYWQADASLEGRDMLLVLRFWGLRFRSGVRVSDVVDDETEVDRRPVRRWGWGYGTLEGHLERGHMDYAVWKWLDTGEVEFHIDAYSRRAVIRNPFVALGFRLFGRREQIAFARYAVDRLAHITRAVLAGGTAAEPVPAFCGGLAISPGRAAR